MSDIKVFEGDTFSDSRGKLKFYNTFDMSEIVRFYEISPASTETIRAWQGHQNEKKWFYCNAGAFIINLVEIDDFENPSPVLNSEKFVLNANQPMVLEIPGGYANGFKAIEKESKLLVFSNYDLNQSAKDDFRFEQTMWSAEW